MSSNAAITSTTISATNTNGRARAMHPARAAAQADARAIVRRARERSGVPFKTMAGVLHMNPVNVQHFAAVDATGTYKHMSVADLLMLARAAETREFCRSVLVEIQVTIEVQGLRLCDIVAMSKRPETAELMRMLMRPAIEACGVTLEEIEPGQSTI